jgi:hypothetical protein
VTFKRHVNLLKGLVFKVVRCNRFSLEMSGVLNKIPCLHLRYKFHFCLSVSDFVIRPNKKKCHRWEEGDIGGGAHSQVLVGNFTSRNGGIVDTTLCVTRQEIHLIDVFTLEHTDLVVKKKNGSHGMCNHYW